MDREPAENITPLLPAKENSDGANPHPKSASNVQPAIAEVVEGATNEQRNLASQPMTASNSTSSMLSIKDPEIAAPYGTRSTRNRGGASRPNYAEDREIEMDFEYQTSAKDINGTKKLQQGDTNSTSNHLAPNARRAGAEGPLNGTNNMAREHIPGTSTFSANPPPSNPQPSKKRKAVPATISSQVNSPAPSLHSISHGQTTTRGAHVVSHVGNGIRDTNMLSFERCGARPNKDGKLIADDGTVLEVNDHVYLVCEPPGEPYYLGRIMEFLHTNNDSSQPVDSLRMNWYYRPKDIGRSVTDTRQIFASMHSDTSPLASLRGKCTIKHKSEFPNLDELRKMKDCFWYDKLFDRYIRRYYEVIPTSQVVNVPSKVKKVLDERWKYILVEAGRGKELTSAVKSCKRCNGYCASNDSVDCAVCRQTYHMNCVRPPLLKKPSRGFAWACGPCSRAHERTLEARNTPNTVSAEGDDDEILDDEEDDGAVACEGVGTGKTSPAPSENTELSIHPGTAEQIHQASLWPFRYLGVHCKVEDALDYDDRIYPRAISRLGPRHQANVSPWPGRPFELVKPPEIKKKPVKQGGHKKESKLSKEILAALEAEKIARENRPKWIVDEPMGFVHRGEDHEVDSPDTTATLLFRLPEVGEASSLPPRGGDDNDLPNHLVENAEKERAFDEYMVQANHVANTQIGIPIYSVNYLDKAANLFYVHNYDTRSALEALRKLEIKDFKEPQLTAAEMKKFEDGVAKFGSELHSVKKHVKTISYGDIVRFYYIWKKTDRGKQIWGNYGTRKGKKQAKEARKTAMADVGKLQDDVADDHDDSAFDNDKALQRKRQFQCKFCSTRTSRQWRRAPNTVAGTMTIAEGKGKDKGTQYVLALCRRCAELWRRYAIQWEDIDEVAKKVAAAGGRAWKRKIDNELLEELQAANEVTNLAPGDVMIPNGALVGPGPPPPPIHQQGPEPPRKRQKGGAEKDMIESAALDSGPPPVPQKKKPVEKPAPPPPPPPPPVKIRPKPKLMPCVICFQMEPLGDQHVSCKECRMTVHRNCYGIVGETSPTRGVRWVCDSCSNDKNPQVSIDYKCILCPHEETKHDFVEPPKISHKKKTEKDRERERQEIEDAKEAAAFYEEKQRETNRPINPREPLKRTANNNWIHVTCAVWTPEVKFGNAKALEPSEGIPSIQSSRYDEVCKICKMTDVGACVSCHQCKATYHVECAHQAGHVLGFDITPVKGSRRDHTNVVNINGETGLMTAAIWCKEHPPTKTIVHRMQDIVNDEGLNALQLYVQNFKQADLALTGTVRKANLVSQSTKAVAAPPATATNRRVSMTAAAAANGHSRGSAAQGKDEESEASRGGGGDALAKICATCGSDVSPKWWTLLPSPTQSGSQPQVAVAEETVEKKEPISPIADGLVIPKSEESPAPLETEPPTINGQASENGHREDIGNQVALAVAALEAPLSSLQAALQFQCHKCHFRKVPLKEPTPPPPPPILVVAPEPQPEPTSAPIPAAPIPEAVPPVIPVAPSEPILSALPYPPQPPPRYTSPWPPTIQPPTTHNSPYSPPGPFGEWPRPPPQMNQQAQTFPVHRYASPLNASVQQSSAAHPLAGQPMIASPQQQNGLGNQHTPLPPAYTPPQHQRTHSNSSASMQNGAFPSYVATRPHPPQHLTNGGPPPRASENPFPQPPQVQNQNHHGPFNMTHGSPPLAREGPPSRDSSNGQTNGGGHPSDGRVNGGASASPSLRNLLS